MKRPALVVAAVLLLLPAATTHAEEQTSISLEQAVRQGLVKVDVSARGGAYGDAVQVVVQRAVPRTVQVFVEPGTVFVSVGGDVQNLVGRRVRGELTPEGFRETGEVMVLADDGRRSFVVESYCLDYEKPQPRKADSFRLAARDPRAARVLVSTPAVGVSVQAVQSAIWMDRAGVSGEQLRRQYGFTEVDVRVAGDVLARAREAALAALPEGVPPEVRQQIERLLSSDPAQRIEAAKALGAMGQRAAAALPFVAESTLAVRPLEAGPGQAAPGVEVQVEIARAIEAMMRNRPVEPLIKSLAHRRPLVRRHAARTLGALGDRKAVEPLIAALEDSDARVRELAVESLKQLTGQDFGRDRAKWEAWWEANKEKPQ